MELHIRSNKYILIYFLASYKGTFPKMQYWPAPPTIHRGFEWPQFLNSLIVLCLFVCLFSVCKFSNFIQYSTVEYSTVQYKAAGPPSRDCSECDYRICSRVNLKTHYQTNCNGCAKRFCGRRHLKSHNTFREAVRLYNILAHSTQ